MTTLDDFSASELELLVSLPYKVGVYVSHADDEDGQLDDEREMDALQSCLKAIASLNEGKPFTAEVMRQTLAMRTDWPRWAGQSFNVPTEAAQAKALLTGHANEMETKNYCRALMEVATTVAQAYGEFGEYEDDEKGGLFGSIVGKITDTLSAMSSDDANHPMNVSAAEDNAISALRDALRG